MVKAPHKITRAEWTAAILGFEPTEEDPNIEMSDSEDEDDGLLQDIRNITRD